MAPLELADTRDHSLGDAAEQVPGRELLAYGVGDRLGLVQVRRGEEDEREVDLGPAQRATAGLARRLRRGAPGRLRGRETGPYPARDCLGLHRGPRVRRRTGERSSQAVTGSPSSETPYCPP